MITNSKSFMLCGVIILLNLFICEARILTSPVYINGPDSSVHANAITNSIKRKPKMGHAYYWYNRNSILSSDGGFSGRLLHGNYTSYFHNHNLKCQGVFDRGLKQGIWITWFSNGKVSERTHYSGGVVDGARELYDSTGDMRMLIYYRNGVRAGKTTIFSQEGADSVIRYKKGQAIVPRVNNDSAAIARKGHRKRKISQDSCSDTPADSVKKSMNRNRDSAHKSKKEKPAKIRAEKTGLPEFFRRKEQTVQLPKANE